MAKYAVILQRTASASLSVGVLTAAVSAPRRAKIYDILFGSEAAPADNAFLWQIQRCSTAGTTTAITPQALDSADGTATTVAGSNATSDPTVTANAMMLTWALNQRSSARWMAAPYGEIVIPATAANGVAIRTPTMTAVTVTATAYIDEQ